MNDLKTNAYLLRLDARRCGVGDDGGDAIAEMLDVNATLTTVVLRENKALSEGKRVALRARCGLWLDVEASTTASTTDGGGVGGEWGVAGGDDGLSRFMMS